MKRPKHLKITLTEEEYDRIKTAAGYEPMASYARRATLDRVNEKDAQKTSIPS